MKNEEILEAAIKVETSLLALREKCEEVRDATRSPLDALCLATLIERLEEAESVIDELIEENLQD